MLEERFRFMYFGKAGTDLKQISLGRKQFYLAGVILSCILLLLSAFVINLFTHTFHNVRITLLEKDRQHLHKELLTIKERVSSLSNELSKVETTGDELRNAASLPGIDKDTRQVGIGGPMYYSSLDFGYYPDEISSTAQEVKVDLDKMERAVRLEVSSLGEISERIINQKDHVARFPSINPILGGRITEDYGLRVDPFIGKLFPHEGVDIPMPVGTKVLATADGVIKIAKTVYTPHKSYGIELVIDHGYGYETRYAHLSNVLVRSGQRVKRWDPVGEVGETGRATGPHLHYEVIYTGNKQNPENYIYN